MAKVIPIHKGGNKTDASNFRPISLTSTTCKLLEHIIIKDIATYLEEKLILSPLQHGFRKGLSTVTQLTKLVHEISQAIDNQKQIDLILLDFSKAFDRVSHKKLIIKIEAVLGKGPVSDWISAYLSNRTQFVEINHQKSEITQVTSGIPQGSILAPILFLIFINDLPASTKTNIRLFTDDCIVYKEINCCSDHLALENDLKSVCQWCVQWQMSLNLGKSALLRITRKNITSEFSYTIGNTQLTPVKEHRYLGLIISDDLRWEAHINHVTSPAIKRLFSEKAPPFSTAFNEATCLQHIRQTST